MFLNRLMSYPLWTLLCAIFFPAVASIATFVCLRRAKTSRKMTGFFIIIPIYVALTVVFLSDTGEIMSDMLASAGSIPFPPFIGLLSAITLGIFSLNITALICGAGLLKPRGAIINSIASLLSLGLSAYITFSTWIAFKGTSSMATDLPIRAVFYKIPLPEFIGNSGTEMILLAILFIFLIVYFISLASLKTPEEIIKEGNERNRRNALSTRDQKPSSKRDIRIEDDIHACCACCEHATILKGDRSHMVCDSFGVVSCAHTCRKFLYDPLKRTARRPRSESHSNNEIPPELDHI